MLRRFLRSIVVAVAVALVAVPAFAETQNVKVSGDINIKAITHHDFDLQGKQGNLGIPPRQSGVVSDDDEGDVLLQTTRVRVDADLTDNVSTTVRLLNQRFWDGQTDADATNNIDLDYAYVTLKELVYSPVTVTVGRQPIHFGTGFVVGDAFFLADPNGTFTGAAGVTPGNTTLAQEFSAYNSYDAVKAVIDFSPLVVTGVWSKIAETGVATNDQTLYGINLNWKGVPVDRWNGEAELYWFYKDDQGFATAVHDNGRAWDQNTVHTIGTRAGVDPIENLHLNGEFAYQFGELEDGETTAGQGYRQRDREGMAVSVSADYTWASLPWTPITSLMFVHYSGEEAGSNGNLNADLDDFEAWDPMFRGQTFTWIHEYFAGTDAAGIYPTLDANDTAANTNRHHIMADLALKPLDDLALKLRYAHIWFAETPVAGRSDEAGDEVNLVATYDYTEDVQFGFLGAWFLPGSYYDEAPNTAAQPRSNALAWELVGDMTVKF